MRKRHVVSAAAVALAFLVGCASPALADGIGKIVAVVNQIFGGSVDGSGATTGQALVKQADGSWKAGTVGASFPLLAPNGTSGAPSYSFSAETALGLYRSGAGTLGVTGTLSILSASDGLVSKCSSTGYPIYGEQTSGVASLAARLRSPAYLLGAVTGQRETVVLDDTSTLAAGVGPGIGFFAFGTGTTLSDIGGIRIVRENATDGQVQARFLITTGNFATAAPAEPLAGLAITSAQNVQLASGKVLGWASGALSPSSTFDTAFSRISAAKVALGNGSASDASGILKLGVVEGPDSSNLTIRTVVGSTGGILLQPDGPFTVTQGNATGSAGGAIYSLGSSTSDGDGGNYQVTAGNGKGSGNAGLIRYVTGTRDNGPGGGAVWQLGNGTGTDQDGGTVSMNCGAMTGKGSTAGTSLGLATYFPGASGTTVSANSGTRVDIHTTRKVITNNTITTFANFRANGIVSGERMTAIRLLYCARATNGTDHQVESGSVDITAVNKAGTITTNVGAKAGNVQSVSAGTLTVTFASVDSGSQDVNVRVTINSSLTTPTDDIAYTVLTQSPVNTTSQ